ncbi:4-hydroxy-tetrahydrodipicolinate reductase [Rathayibacter sp. YIM 133350]|uniref:4-hydroxy-tetrahydrodipicolinate reductase n=1 Tax=Rathayibacter sp. YIM 133350 TaxID=3131992 RepID=UPI00307E987A
MTQRVAVVGATGKLGRQVSALVRATDDFELVAELDSRSSFSEMLAGDLVVDVSHPAVSQEVVEFAIENGRRVLVGTSGWTQERIDGLRSTVAAHEGTAVIIVPNFSLGSVIGTLLATVAARYFDSIEIVEAHHAGKVDSPSGTAVRTAELIGAARGDRGPVEAAHTDQRARGQQVASIPVHSLRLEGVQASQQVIFGGRGETLSVRHDTVSPEAYEQGILLALRRLADAEGITVGLDNLIDLGIGR